MKEEKSPLMEIKNQVVHDNLGKILLQIILGEVKNKEDCNVLSLRSLVFIIP